MKQILIPNTKGYKANLHCHTTDSDGRMTPEEVCKYYKDHGYSIVAITDHLYMRDRTHLNSNDFVCLNGYENNILEWNMIDDSKNVKLNPLEGKCYHFNFYSPSPNKIGMVCVSEYFFNHFNKNKTPEDKALCPILDEFIQEGVHSLEIAQKGINKAIEEGYIVCYNHPVWSNHEQNDFCGLKGLTAMEMVNGGSYLSGLAEDNQYIYDLMLKDGQNICCLANDDNHNLHPDNDDSFVGFNVMFPKELTYESVFECLKLGNLYCSTGALFKEIYIENNIIHVLTEDECRYIKLTSNGGIAKKYYSKNGGLFEAVFDLNKYDLAKPFMKYFRITIENINGERAYTRGYFAGKDFVWE